MSETIARQVLSLRGPAGILSARLESPQSPTRRAVVAHPHPLHGGTMDNAVVRILVERLVVAGTAVLSFDFRGVRTSRGTFDDGEGEQLDLLAAERELEERFPGLPHWLAGYSFGAFVSLARLAKASAFDVDAMLLLAPPLSNHEPKVEGPTPPIALVTAQLDALTAEPGVRKLASVCNLVHHDVLAGAGHDLGTAGPPGSRALAGAIDRSIESLASASS